MKSEKIDIGTIKALGYLGIFVLLLFIILPPLFRVLFPVEDNPKKEVVIMNLNCDKIEDFEGYKIKTTIDTKYVDSNINYSTITYEVIEIGELADISNIKLEEYNALKVTNNIDFEESNNKYIIKIDYGNFDYSEETLLEGHRNVISKQMELYEENSFSCDVTQIN